MSRVPAPSTDIDRAKGGGGKTATPAAAAAGKPRLRNSGPLLVILFVAITVIVVEIATGQAWTVLFINPLINALVFLDIIVLGEFGVAILLFTLILRVVTLPLTISQFRSMKEMQAIGPLQEEIKKKYKDPKRRQEETMKLFRERHINPLGCLAPTLIQFVFFFALYRALVPTVGGSPESLIGLSQHLYPLSFLQESIPLKQTFLWLDLGQPDKTYILSFLVAAATYVQQRVSITPNASAQQQQQQQMMLFMMPMMMVFMTLSLPSGVGVYWVATNVFSLFASWRVYGRDFHWKTILSLPTPAPAPTVTSQQKKAAAKSKSDQPSEETDEASPPQEARPTHGQRRGKRKNRR